MRPLRSDIAPGRKTDPFTIAPPTVRASFLCSRRKHPPLHQCKQPYRVSFLFRLTIRQAFLGEGWRDNCGKDSWLWIAAIPPMAP